MDALLLGDLDEEGLVAEGTNPVLPNPAEEIVKKRSMALDRWFLAARASGVQASTQPTPQQTTPFASRQQRKRHKGTKRQHYGKHEDNERQDHNIDTPFKFRHSHGNNKI